MTQTVCEAMVIPTEIMEGYQKIYNESLEREEYGMAKVSGEWHVVKNTYNPKAPYEIVI